MKKILSMCVFVLGALNYSQGVFAECYMTTRELCSIGTTHYWAGSTTGCCRCETGYRCENGNRTKIEPSDPIVCSPGQMHYMGYSGYRCIPCPMGSYSTFDDSLACMSCHPGTHVNTATRTACVSCEPGEYSNEQAMLKWFDTQDSAAKSQYEADHGTYTFATPFEYCLKCPNGSYSGSGAIECTQCTAEGTNPDAAASEGCSCLAGYYRPEGEKECASCPVGSYCKGGTKATPCESNQWSWNTAKAASDCKPCPTGSTLKTTKDGCDCPSGKIFDQATNSCITCDEGPVVDGNCTTCLEGTYWDPATTQCKDCEPGWACSGGKDRTECSGEREYSTAKSKTCSTCTNGILTNHEKCESYAGSCSTTSPLNVGDDCTIYTQLGGCCPSESACLQNGATGRYTCQQVAPTTCPTPLIAKDASCTDYAGLPNNCCAAGLTCTGGKCVCGTKPGFNNACTTDCGCQDGFTCSENVCKCPTGTNYDSATNTCLPTAACPTPLVGKGESCATHVGKGLANDCCVEGLTCTEGQCICANIPGYNNPCTSLCGCQDGFTCSENVCKCPSDKRYDEASRSCVNKEDTSCEGVTCGTCQVCDKGNCVTDTTKEGSAVGECGVCRGGSVQKDSSKETDCKTCSATDWKLVLKDAGSSCGQCKECTASGTCQTVGTTCGTECCAEGQTCRDNQCQGTITTCDPGKYIKDNKCETCPAGSYCQDGKKTTCAAHYYSAAGAGECTECHGPVNDDHTQCSKCGEGQYWKNNSCTGCEGDVNDDHTTCTPCAEGKRYNSTSHRCEEISCDSEPAKKCLQGNECVCCAPKTLFDGSKCVCPAGTIEIEGACQQKPDACPAELLKKEAPCALYEGKTNSCCESGLTCTSGTCQCATKPSTYQASCNVDCGCAGEFDCKNGQCACPDGKDYDAKEKKCAQACNPGEYREGGNVVPCPAGSYCPGDGSIHLAPAGTYTLPGADTPVQCEEGTFSSKAGSTGCTPCPVGTYSDKEGATACTPCSAGSYNTEEKSKTCTLCPEGTFNSEAGSTACTPCAAGSYSARKGSTSCILCPVGYHNNADGLAQCEPCAANTYTDKEGSTTCKACPSGKVSSEAASTCRWKCRAGYYFDGTECAICLAGSFCSGDEASQLCPAGQFSAKDKSTVCTKCPAGSYAPMSGMTACVLCPEKTFSATEGATVCERCPKGTTSSLGATSCVESYECHDGEYLYMNECIECPAGFYCSGDKKIVCPMGHQCPAGATEPVECLAGRYSDRTGASKCTICGKGTISAQGASNCTKCTTGPSNEEHTQCIACEEGKYYNGSRCTSCPANATCSGGVMTCNINYTRLGSTCTINLRRK